MASPKLSRGKTRSGWAGAFALSAALIAVSGGRVAAQGTSEPAPPSADGPEVLATATVTSRTDPAATLSPEEMVQQAALIVQEITNSQKELTSLLGDSKNQKDVVLVLCVGDKSNQVQLALDTAKDRNEAMNEALADGDQPRARHEFALLVVVGDGVRKIAVDASQCVGAEDAPTQWDLIANVDSSVPKLDPKELPFIEVTSIVPVVASPTE